MRTVLGSRLPLLLASVFFLLGMVIDLVAPPPQPVYAVEGQLVFLPPNAIGDGNKLRADPSALILFASAVEREYNNGPQTARLASSSATLYGIGVRDGSRVTLPDEGGQWASRFDNPYLRIEVVSSSATESRARFAAIVSELQGIVAARQRDAQVPRQNLVDAELTTPDPGALLVAGSRTRQLAGGAALAAICSLAAGAIANRWQRRPTAALPSPVAQITQPA